MTEPTLSSYEGSDGDEPLLITIDGPIFTIPVLSESLLYAGALEGELFDPEGEIPQQIIASSDTCQIVSINSKTGAVNVLWEYPDIRIEDHHRDSNFPKEPMALEDWIPCDYIIELEWINPSYILVSHCCEPAAGWVEVINIATSEPPTRYVNAGLPSTNSEKSLVYTQYHSFGFDGNNPAYVITFWDWDVQNTGSSEQEYYGLGLASGNSSDVSVWIDQANWVGDSKIAFELWTRKPFSKIGSLITLIDIPSQSITVKGRGHGWMKPSGDASGNLVVAEQSCYAIPLSCRAPESKVVALDPDTLTPIHEVSFDQNIAELDLVRGWLLVTFADGQVGTLDLADGTFTPIAEGIVTATWME